MKVVRTLNIDELTKELLYDLYFVKNMTQYEIAELFGVRQNVISVRFKKFGFIAKSKWKDEEIEFLKDRWGVMGVNGIAKKLGRSYNSICVKAKRLGLSGATLSRDSVNANQLAKALNVDGKTVHRWIKNKGLKAVKKSITKSAFYWIDIEYFWKWAYINKNIVKWRNVEPNILGKEPDWVSEERNKSFKEPLNRNYKWTKKEDGILKMYWGYKTADEIGKILGRTKAGVLKRARRLNLKKLVIAIPFKPIEDETLIDMKLKGLKDKDIAEELGRSEESVRFRRQTLINQDKLDWQYRKSVSC